MSKKLRILHTVEHYLPFRCGMQEVVTRISEALVNMGHDVTVATTRDPARHDKIINGVKVVDFEIAGNDVNSYLWGETKKYQDFILNGNFDIVVNFAAQQWATDLCYPLLPKLKAKKIFVPTGFSGLFWKDYENYFREMPHILRQYDQIIIHANEYQDAHFIRQHNLDNYVVIPNGASNEEFSAPLMNVKKELNIPPDQKIILLVGNHTGTKGHIETIEMFSKANITGATLVIVGKKTDVGCTPGCIRRQNYFNLFPFIELGKGKKGAVMQAVNDVLNLSAFTSYKKRKKIVVADLSREKLVSLFKESYMFIFPSLIECFPIVLIEAMAAGLPSIVSNAGSMREVIKTSESGMVLTSRIVNGFSIVDVNEGAAMIEHIYNNPELRDLFAANARKAYLQNYQWESIVKRYEAEYLATKKVDHSEPLKSQI